MPLRYFPASWTFVPQLFVSLALSSGVLLSQDVQMVPDQQDRDSATKAQAQKDQDQAPVTTFKANVDVVQLFFNVKDKKGGLIANLPKENFEILEDGKPQTIKYFSATSNLPLTLGILIDSSGSQQRVLDMEKQVGGAFLQDILTEKDAALLISFDVSVDLLHDFTNNMRALKVPMNSAKINTEGADCDGIPGMRGGAVPCIGKQKGTLLYDAVCLASHDKMSEPGARKSVVLLPDGPGKR